MTMPVQLSLDTLKLYFDGGQRHRAYKETVDLMNAIRTHADGIIPEKLIKERRPSESESTLEYRKTIYVPKTKNPIGKVISSLSKIRRSPDWSVMYDEKNKPASIVDEESLESYCEENYPEHTSVTNWMFSNYLKNYCIDANAVVAVLPLNLDAAEKNEYYKPIAIVFNSNQVIFYEDGEQYCVLQSTERSTLTPYDPNNFTIAGKVFYVITTSEYAKWEQSTDNGYTRTQYLVHNKGRLPAFRIRAQFLKQKENATIQESRIAGMLPSLDEAAREYSDLQAAKVQHMYPLFWYYQSKACQPCNGVGKIATTTGTEVCNVCNGSGKVKFSPYAHLEVEPPKIGDTAVPYTQPAGYISRDVEIIKHQEDSVKNHLFDALASINMQFLDQTPLNISGEAKNVDREELNNFVYSVAEDIVMVMDKIYWWINEWRYAVVLPDAKARKAMLPQIVVPEQFDLLPADYIMEGISKAKTAKVNPLLVAAMEEDYASKAFYNNPALSGVIAAYYELDPLTGLSSDEKMTLIMNKGITQEDYVTSAYIVPFVKRAIAEDPNFLSKKLADKKKVLTAYAKEKMDVVDEAEKLKQEMMLEQQQALAGTQQPFNGGR
jgi:hypothetical protein